MSRNLLFCFALGGLALLAASPTLADDWLVSKMRGGVQMRIDGNWHDLKRGDLVPDGSFVRTADNGHAELTRGAESVDLSTSTVIVIEDRDGRKYTVVHQLLGVVEVEAEVRNVEHFEVRTPTMAAVVKGTHFTVAVDDDGNSGVSVQRGHVAVRSDDGQRLTLSKGQAVTVNDDGQVEVFGGDELPIVTDRNGKAVGQATNANAQGKATSEAAKAKNDDKSNKGKGENSGKGKGKDKDDDDSDDDEDEDDDE